MKRNIRSLFTTILITALLAAGLYADVSISASVDRNTVNFGESVTLLVTVSGDAASIPKPALPQIADFNVYSSGTSQNISFVNGRVSSSLTYSFILSPVKPGKFTIPPVVLNFGGKAYPTAPIQIEVLAAAQQQKSTQQKQQVNVKEDAGGRDIFVTAQLDKSRARVNEGITYTMRFFTARQLLSQPEYGPPNFTGFFMEDLPPQRTYQATLNGSVYNVVEIKSKLFPTSPGAYNLGTASIRANVQDFSQDPFGGAFNDSFFRGLFGGGKTVEIKSKPISIEVVALPSAGKPQDFSGAVGSYSIKASVDKSELEANGPLTFTVEVAGEGNIKSIPAPKIPAIAGIRKYDTVASMNVSKADYRVTGSKVFKTVLVPERTGSVILPELEFSYFDPAQSEYRTIKTRQITVKVSPSSNPGSAAAAPSGEQVNVIGQDIRFIKSGPDAVSARAVSAIADILLIFAALIFIFSAGYNRYTAFSEKNYDFLKSRRAFGNFSKAISKLKTGNAPPAECYGILYDLIIRYFSDKTQANLAGVTFAEMEAMLASKNLPKDRIDQVRRLLDEADFIRFAPKSSGGDARAAAEHAGKIISDIEKAWKI
jgi:hypothetical protein